MERAHDWENQNRRSSADNGSKETNDRILRIHGGTALIRKE